jgi:hypothetical protein
MHAAGLVVYHKIWPMKGLRYHSIFDFLSHISWQPVQNQQGNPPLTHHFPDLFVHIRAHYFRRGLAYDRGYWVFPTPKLLSLGLQLGSAQPSSQRMSKTQNGGRIESAVQCLQR